jgi:hypothetical protein
MIGWGKEMRPALLRHRTARAVPRLFRHQSRGIVANRSWGSDLSVNSVFSVVNTVVVDRKEPTPRRSRRSACMQTPNQPIPPSGPRHQEIATRERHGLQEPKTRDQHVP